jgi:hypothetical protein
VPAVLASPLLEVLSPGVGRSSEGGNDPDLERDLSEVLDALACEARGALECEAAGGEGASGLLGHVLSRSGAGGAGLPDRLVLDLVLGEDVRPLAPVLCGDALVGFVEDGDAGAPARVRLLNATPENEPPRRLAAEARPVAARADEAPERLRFVVEPAGARDPFALHVLKPDLPHLRTWGSDREFLARTAADEDVPPGLRIGRVRTLGYRDPDFVLDWFLEPEVDPRAIHAVAVLGSVARGGPAESAERHPFAHGAVVEARALGRADCGSLSRGFLARVPREARRGAAVLDGLRCLGRIAWTHAGVALVRRFGDGGEVWPVLYRERRGQAPEALVLRSRGWRGDACLFEVSFARRTPMAGSRGTLFTGAVSYDCPKGLLLGEARFLSPSLLEARPARARALPRALTVFRSRHDEVGS